MDASVALVGFASFIGGLLVVSRMMHWLALLVRSAKAQSTDGARKRTLPVLVPLVLHSGLWTLVLASVAMYYVTKSSRGEYVPAAYAGVGLAAALVLGGSLWSVLRKSHTRSGLPLTPERLLSIRRRFFWSISLFFAASFVAGFSLFGLTPPEAPGFAVMLFPLGFAGGWVWCWFMWQWYGAALQVREKHRRQREGENAV